MGEMIKIEEMPSEVQWVWGIKWARQAIGLKTLEAIKVIIKANPKYFPWETKYDSIPQSVHDAYNKEKYACMDELYKQTHDANFIGLTPFIMKMDELPEYPPEPQKSLSEIITDLFKMEDDKRKRQQKEDEKNKSLWDKYYQPYGLEYRK